MGRLVGASMWWGYLVTVLFIILFIIFVIKIFIEFPGLAEWRFVFSDDEELSSDDTQLESVEIGREINGKGSAITDNSASCKKNAKVKAAKEESSNDEIVAQSTVDKHALLSNFMSS